MANIAKDVDMYSYIIYVKREKVKNTIYSKGISTEVENDVNIYYAKSCLGTQKIFQNSSLSALLTTVTDEMSVRGGNICLKDIQYNGFSIPANITITEVYNGEATTYPVTVAPDAGSMWYADDGVPSVAAEDNDLYLDTATGDVYQYLSSSWGSPIMNITGDKGDQGDAGTDAGYTYKLVLDAGQDTFVGDAITYVDTGALNVTLAETQLPITEDSKVTTIATNIVTNTLNIDTLLTLQINGSDTDAEITIPAGETGPFTFTVPLISTNTVLVDEDLISVSVLNVNGAIDPEDVTGSITIGKVVLTIVLT